MAATAKAIDPRIASIHSATTVCVPLTKIQTISIRRTKTTIPRVKIPRILDNLARTFCNGVSSSTSSSRDLAILPISVAIPVAVTMPLPRPYVTGVDI